jgi:hypothetical protein
VVVSFEIFGRPAFFDMFAETRRVAVSELAAGASEGVKTADECHGALTREGGDGIGLVEDVIVVFFGCEGQADAPGFKAWKLGERPC